MTSLRGFHHVQLAMPAGGEEPARAFYVGLLGLVEVQKPEPLARRGGLWFEAGEVRLHLGIDADFRPPAKAHPAILVDELEPLLARSRELGYEVRRAEPVSGLSRGYVFDPFGNRIELVHPGPDPQASPRISKSRARA